MQQAAPDTSKIALIGAPSSAGARKVGQEQAPKALRDAGLIQSLETSGHAVEDLGDIQVVTFTPDTEQPKQQNLPRVIKALQQVEQQSFAAAVIHLLSNIGEILVILLLVGGNVEDAEAARIVPSRNYPIRIGRHPNLQAILDWKRVQAFRLDHQHCFRDERF